MESEKLRVYTKVVGKTQEKGAKVYRRRESPLNSIYKYMGHFKGNPFNRFSPLNCNLQQF